MQLLARNEEYLLERLSEEEKILSEKYVDAWGELNGLTAVGNLIYGYELRVMMAAEIFVGMDNLFQCGGDH